VLRADSGLDPALIGKPATDTWTTYHGDYSARRYSTLDQINATNVKNLTLAWIYRANTSSQGAQIGGDGPDQAAGPGASTSASPSSRPPCS
jgi:glucose dehydrogenase